MIVAVSDNSLSVLLLVGSELSEQKFALEILKQRLTSFRIKLDDDCCPRFLRGQSGFFEPLLGSRKPGPS